MASQFTTPFSVQPLTGGGHKADPARQAHKAGKADLGGNQEQPVVLLAFAKLVILGAALALFLPYWLQLLQTLAESNWGALRVVSLGGGALIVGLAGFFVKVWTGLLKHLARAD